MFLCRGIVLMWSVVSDRWRCLRSREGTAFCYSLTVLCQFPVYRLLSAGYEILIKKTGDDSMSPVLVDFY